VISALRTAMCDTALWFQRELCADSFSAAKPMMLAES